MIVDGGVNIAGPPPMLTLGPTMTCASAAVPAATSASAQIRWTNERDDESARGVDAAWDSLQMTRMTLQVAWGLQAVQKGA